MPFSVTVNDSRITARLATFPARVRARLKSEIKPLADKLADEIRARSAAHIHTFGKKPGFYLATIHGGVADTGTEVVGYVRSGSPLAHLLEAGTKAHAIFPKKASVLAFEVGGKSIFARSVQTPGTKPYPTFKPVLADRREEIVATLTAAIRGEARNASP